MQSITPALLLEVAEILSLASEGTNAATALAFYKYCESMALNGLLREFYLEIERWKNGSKNMQKQPFVQSVQEWFYIHHMTRHLNLDNFATIS